MGWNKSALAVNEKLRLLSTKINSNSEAIEEADETTGTPILQRAILLPDRSDAAIATAPNPAVVGATTYLFSKQDTDSIQEFFVRTVLPTTPLATSNVIQMTKDGRIGSEGTDFQMKEFRFVSNDTTYNAGNIVKARASIDASGNLSAGSSNVTSTSVASAVFTINVTGDVLDSANYQVIATPVASTSFTCGVSSKPTPVSPNIVAIKVSTFRSDTGAALATPIDVMVIGGV